MRIETINIGKCLNVFQLRHTLHINISVEKITYIGGISDVLVCESLVESTFLVSIEDSVINNLHKLLVNRKKLSRQNF